jgi:hypothetical protein
LGGGFGEEKSVGWLDETSFNWCLDGDVVVAEVHILLDTTGAERALDMFHDITVVLDEMIPLDMDDVVAGGVSVVLLAQPLLEVPVLYGQFLFCLPHNIVISGFDKVCYVHVRAHVLPWSSVGGQEEIWQFRSPDSCLAAAARSL